MSNTAIALLIKFAATFAAAWFSVGAIDGNTLGWVFLIAIVGTLINYVIGDLAVLPSLGNILASIGDGVMAALVAYIVALFIIDVNVSMNALVIFAVIVAVVEFFFHIFLQRSDTVAPKE